MERPKDLTGRKFGKWTVLPRYDVESDYRCRKWLVQCECGNLRLVLGHELLNGRSQSCDCAPRRKKTDEETASRTSALRRRLHRVMKDVGLERLEPRGKSEGARESGLIGENTESDWRMIV